MRRASQVGKFLLWQARIERASKMMNNVMYGLFRPHGYSRLDQIREPAVSRRRLKLSMQNKAGLTLTRDTQCNKILSQLQ